MGIIKSIGTIERTLHKNEIIELAEANAQEVIDSGKFDMLKVYAELKRYELYLKTIIEKTKEMALEKACLFGCGVSTGLGKSVTVSIWHSDI